MFTSPKAEFHQSILSGHKKKKLPYPLSNEQSVSDHFRTYGDEEEVQAMLAAKKFLEGELRNVKARLLRVDSELDEVKTSLATMKDVELSVGAAGVGVTASSTGGGNNTKGGTGSGKARNKPKKKATASESLPAAKKTKTGS